MTISKLAKKWAENGSYEAEIYQAYIDLVGAEYATAEEAEEAYCGQFDSDEIFAQDMAEQLGNIDKNLSWPNNCIDWKQASSELMYDYSEQDGYYFRNM